MENKSGITPTLAISCEDFEKIKNSIEEKDKEIERLKGALQTHEILLQSNTKEVERLNNIINELEEELERESNMKEEDTCLEHNTFIDIKNTLKTVLKRLQELKGGDENEQKHDS